MPTPKTAPYRGSFMLMVDSKTRQIDVDKLRAQIAVFLANRPTPRAGGCRTIQGPGNVILCEGTCTKPGFSCEPKRNFNGTYTCACQKPIMQARRATTSRRATSRRAKAR